VLSDSLPEGNYRVRSYTNWMRNFNEDYFFDQVIAVGNALSSDVITTAAFKFNGAGNKNNDTAIIVYNQ
jgi:hypothetical protein